MANSNIINAVFGSGLCAVTTSAFRANYGMVLRFSGIDLPTAFECDFSNYDVAGHDSITAIGQNNEVQIPDDMWDSGLNIYAYVYLHPTDDSGVTVYTVTIPVLGRPNRTEEEPTPHEQTVIEQAISALNDAVEQTAADVASADASAQAAALSEANASASERSAAASASAALASQNAAESAAQSATESASGAAESARNAANSASQAAESATSAQESAEQAERSVQSITDDVERSERAANTATGKATEAASSAATASTKATQAEQSATAAAQSASSASSAAQNAASSATAAESSATDANTAKTAAQAAQAAAEQAAESVSGLSAQIEQNTADIADLVQSKAGVLVDTATGSIASFVPDATVPTVKGLIVDVEPVQDLHGYDHPWPAGGGVNKIAWADGIDFTLNGIRYYVSDGKLYLNGTSIGETSSDNATFETNFKFTLKAGSYYFTRATGALPTYLIHYVDGVITSLATNSRAFTLSQDEEVWVGFYVYKRTFNNEHFPVQLVSGSTEPTAFAPYSNICPISGWDEVEVPRTGKNLSSVNELADRGPQWGGDQAPIKAVINSLPVGTYTLSNKYEILEMPSSGKVEHGAIYVTAMINGKQQPVNRYTTVLDNSPYLGKVYEEQTVITITEENKGKINHTYTYCDQNPSHTGRGRGKYRVFDIQLELGSTATAYTPYQGETYQIQFGQTVYGGTLDVTTGVLTVDRAMVDLGTLNWNKINTTGSHWRFWAYLNDMAYGGEMLSSQYKHITASQSYMGDIGIASQASGSSYLAMVTDERFSDAATFKTAMSGVQLVYELATPITIDLTPVEVAVITGQTNNIWADCGDVSVEYAADLKTYIDNKIAAAVAALS